jgi:beta-glucosidase
VAFAFRGSTSLKVGVSIAPKLLSTWDATNHVWKRNGGVYQMIAGN